MTSEKLRGCFSQGNGSGPWSEHEHALLNQQERARYLKYAIFYLAVAALLFFANELARSSRTDMNQSDGTLDVSLDLSIGPNSGPTSMNTNPSAEAAHAIRFRLTNRGNRLIFYPVYPRTNRLMGHIVYRTGARSPWTALSWPKGTPSIVTSPGMEETVSWIALSPDAWVDGLYDDPGIPSGDRAYEIDLRFSPNDKVRPFFSRPYHLNTQ